MAGTLMKRPFIALLVTQFFGAANDNILKGVITFMVIDGVWAGQLGKGGQGVVALCFTLPFIILSGYSGQFADRFSKQRMAVVLKGLEIPIVLVAMIGLWTSQLHVTLASLVLLAIHSTFFGPAKYGMIPELVSDSDLSRANGVINLMTNLAVIAGMVAAGIIADRYHPRPASLASTLPGMRWLPGAAMLVVAFAGLAAVSFLPRLQPAKPGLIFNWNPMSAYVHALREMAKSPLLAVAMAWGYFYLLAGMALLIIPEYATVLQIDNEHASYLLGVMAIAIGVGSGTAGLISGKHIESRLVPVGAAGMMVFFTLLGVVPPTFWTVAALIAGAGFFAGFYIIPLQALLQHLSPPDERGRFLGASNGLSFAFFAVASLIYWMMRPAFGNEPQRIFLVCAALIFVGGALFMAQLRRVIFRGKAVV